jgi:putative tricarboxylic transport membrane protein
MMKRDNLIDGLVLFLFGLLTSVFSLKMPVGNFRAAGSGLFPLCLGLLLMGLSLLFILITLGGKTKPAETPVGTVEKSESSGRILPFLGLLVLITQFFNTLGYPLASFLLMVGLLWILGTRQWIVNLLLSLVTAIGSYFLFVHWLKIPLPKGFLGL